MTLPHHTTTPQGVTTADDDVPWSAEELAAIDSLAAAHEQDDLDREPGAVPGADHHWWSTPTATTLPAPPKDPLVREAAIDAIARAIMMAAEEIMREREARAQSQTPTA